jgi:hypothetical protein
VKRFLGVLLIAFSVALSACTPCDLVLKYGIGVTIVDDATGTPFEGGVTVVATEGSYIETVTPPVFAGEPRTAALAPERPGTYRVEVQAPGYVTTIVPSVRVTKDDCHVRPVQVTVRLEKAGSG